MGPHLTPTEPLSQSVVIASRAARDAAERAASIGATAAETRLRAEQILAEVRAVREARQSRRV
jgi:hypothetical protein